MHELSIAQALVEQLEKVVEDNGAKGLSEIRLEIGTLSGVDPEALRLAFPFAAESTSTEGATLQFETVTATALCSDCGAESEPDFPFFVCESCGSAAVEISGGRELLIKSVELITEP